MTLHKRTLPLKKGGGYIGEGFNIGEGPTVQAGQRDQQTGKKGFGIGIGDYEK